MVSNFFNSAFYGKVTPGEYCFLLLCTLKMNTMHLKNRIIKNIIINIGKNQKIIDIFELLVFNYN